MARPTKLTPERRDLIVKALREGNYIEAACGYAGVGVSTYYEWMERGRKAKRGIYAEFAEAVEKARAEAEMRNVQTIQKASRDTWQASAWWLERSFPERWGRRVQDVKHSGGVAMSLSVEDVRKLSDDELAKLRGGDA